MPGLLVRLSGMSFCFSYTLKPGVGEELRAKAKESAWPAPAAGTMSIPNSISAT
jgi:hypothetical protein